MGAWYPPTPEAEMRYKESASSKRWPLDVAIDCIKHMDENDKDYIVHHLQTSEYHFGYAMAIRNNYIYSSTKYNSFEPDWDSSQIMMLIFSILHGGYDYKNEVCTGFYESFEYSNLFRQYGETEREIFTAIEERIFNKDYGFTVDDALKTLK